MVLFYFIRLLLGKEALLDKDFYENNIVLVAGFPFGSFPPSLTKCGQEYAVSCIKFTDILLNLFTFGIWIFLWLHMFII